MISEYLRTERLPHEMPAAFPNESTERHEVRKSGSEREDQLAKLDAVLRLPCRGRRYPVYRCRQGLTAAMRCALLRADVLHHRRVSPLLFAPLVQGRTDGAVLARPRGHDRGPEGPAL